MVGYVESLSDPSYHCQLLVLTYPLIGNYGVPDDKKVDKYKICQSIESTKIWASALIIDRLCENHSHWEAVKSLDQWLKESNVTALCGIDTRKLTKIIREKGTMMGKVTPIYLISSLLGNIKLLSVT